MTGGDKTVPMKTDTERLLERVRKLLALATSPNVHEAALAAARAQELIDRHRLQRLLDAEQEAEEAIVAAREEPLAEARRIRKWKSVLAASLASLNGCLAYTEKRGKMTRIVLVGTEEDRAATVAMWEGLLKRVEWLSATHLDGVGQDKRWHDAFRIGAVDTIVRRLREQQQQATASLETTALTVVQRGLTRRRERVRSFAEANLNLKPGRGVTVDAAAYSEGKAAGHQLRLPKQ